MNDPQRPYTTAEAAEIMGCSSDRILQLIKSGHIKAIRLGEKKWAIPRPAFRRLLEGDEEPAPAVESTALRH